MVAELKRSVDNGSFKRVQHQQADTVLSSRYVSTWERQDGGSRIMKLCICVKGSMI